MSEADFRKYHAMESYLLGEVATRFHKKGALDAFDFFCIVIWKANRAKSFVADRLLSGAHDDLESAVKALTASIANATSDRERMRILVSDWGFRLPMASAILAILYSDTFTIYDVRVCDALNDFHAVQNRTNFENLWSGYEDFVQAVRNRVKAKYDLRDKDRWLWGKSFCEQLQSDIKSSFK